MYDKTQFTCLVVPWWHRASKVTALLLVINAVAVMWAIILEIVPNNLGEYMFCVGSYTGALILGNVTRE
jgi:hypothetical protein